MVRQIFDVASGLVKGLGVTLRWMVSPSITVQYPKEKKKMSPRYRGALGFRPDVCISCDMCVRACPSDCISLESVRNPETKRKDLKWYKIDFAKCNYCRLCEEICPTKPKAVFHTHAYELTFDNREDFVMEWKPENKTTDQPDTQVWSKFLPKK